MASGSHPTAQPWPTASICCIFPPLIERITWVHRNEEIKSTHIMSFNYLILPFVFQKPPKISGKGMLLHKLKNEFVQIKQRVRRKQLNKAGGLWLKAKSLLTTVGAWFVFARKLHVCCFISLNIMRSTRTYFHPPCAKHIHHIYSTYT